MGDLLTAPQRFRQRYIVFKLGDCTSLQDFKSKIEEFYADSDFSYHPWVVLFDDKVRKGLLKCGHKQRYFIEEAIENSGDLDVEILGVSGTIKKAKIKFLSNCSDFTS